MDLSERTGSSTRHPWEIARADFFLRLLERERLLDGDDWLDAGAGDAWFARQVRERLPQAASVTCWDANYSTADLEGLGERGDDITYVVERPAGRFGRILMLDVIEHVEDDVEFVGGVVRELLREDGFVLISVPAYQSLWSSHDRALRHYRRYSPSSCRRLLERAGLAVTSSGGLFLSLLPPGLGRALAYRLRPDGSDRHGLGNWSRGRAVTEAITRALALDGRLSLAASAHGISVPGLSFWALCRPARA